MWASATSLEVAPSGSFWWTSMYRGIGSPSCRSVRLSRNGPRGTAGVTVRTEPSSNLPGRGEGVELPAASGCVEVLAQLLEGVDRRGEEAAGRLDVARRERDVRPCLVESRRPATARVEGSRNLLAGCEVGGGPGQITGVGTGDGGGNGEIDGARRGGFSRA